MNPGKRGRDESCENRTNKRQKIEIQDTQENEVPENYLMEIDQIEAHQFKPEAPQKIEDLPDELQILILEQLFITSIRVSTGLKRLSLIAKVNRRFYFLVKYLLEEDYNLIKLINNKFSVIQILSVPKLYKIFQVLLLKLFNDACESDCLFLGNNSEKELKYLDNQLNHIVKLTDNLFGEALLHFLEKHGIHILIEDCYKNFINIFIKSGLNKNKKTIMAGNFYSLFRNFIAKNSQNSTSKKIILISKNCSNRSKIALLEFIIELFKNNSDCLYGCLEIENCALKNIISCIFCNKEIELKNILNFSSYNHDSVFINLNGILEAALELCNLKENQTFDIEQLNKILVNKEKIFGLIATETDNLFRMGVSILCELMLYDGKLDYLDKLSFFNRALRQFQPHIAKLLFKYGMTLNEIEDVGVVLYSSIKNGMNKNIEILLENGLDPNFKFLNDVTLLMFAVKERYVETVELLLKMGANVFAKDSENKTALTFAVRSNKSHRLEIIKLLFEYGIDPLKFMVDLKGENAESIYNARTKKPKKLTRFLIKQGFSID